ncbi:hypothetical protein BDW59DRAFT_164325 [Aspergillus cavernicola]|uniref:Uncharacterized protein n=1 Tax=Aspergillus cavernicola TaxID=176166 RepID=A0ABR4I1V0_9EURO
MYTYSYYSILRISIYPTWQVRPSPNSPSIALNGTAQEVYTQLLKINPDYDEDWHITTTPERETEYPVSSSSSSSRLLLDTRAVKHDIKCRGFLDATEYGTFDGVKTLRKMATGSSKPRLGAGKCEKVACSYKSKISWCNDGKKTKTLPSYNNIADAAIVIYDLCSGPSYRVQGQLGHNDHWRVIVEYADC